MTPLLKRLEEIEAASSFQKDELWIKSITAARQSVPMLCRALRVAVKALVESKRGKSQWSYCQAALAAIAKELEVKE